MSVAADVSQVEIRRVGPADTALFERVAVDVFDEPINPRRLALYLGERGHHMLVAIHRDEIIAQVAAVIHRHPDKKTELYIDEVGVTPAFQRQGLARRMLDMMLAFGRSEGCEEAWVGTELDNIPANRLYAPRSGPPERFALYVIAL